MEYPRLQKLSKGKWKIRLPILLTRAYIRHVLVGLRCQLGDLNHRIPDIGGSEGRPSERWFRWARGYCSLARAYTPCNGTQVSVVDYVESLLPGSRQLVAGPLRTVADHKWRHNEKVSRFLLTLDSELIDPLFILSRCNDEAGYSRYPASLDQIRDLCQFTSMDALAAALVLYKEIANVTWACIEVNEDIRELALAIASTTPELGEDKDLFPIAVQRFLEHP